MILNRHLRTVLRKLGLDEASPPSETLWLECLRELSQLLQLSEQEQFRLERSLDTHAREVQSLFDALNRERVMVEALLGSLPVGWILVDEDGRILRSNPEFEALCGYSQAELSDLSLAELGVDTGLPSGRRAALLIHKSGHRLPVQLTLEHSELDRFHGTVVLVETDPEDSQEMATQEELPAVPVVSVASAQALGAAAASGPAARSPVDGPPAAEFKAPSSQPPRTPIEPTSAPTSLPAAGAPGTPPPPVESPRPVPAEAARDEAPGAVPVQPPRAAQGETPQAPPVPTQPATAETTPVAVATPPPTVPPEGPLKVLLVEDEPVAQMITQQLVESLGNQCLLCEDGNQAMKQVRRQSVDVVISGYLMPGMNGVELCRRIRAEADIRQPYFILLTATDLLESGERATDSGVDTVLAKPVDVILLGQRLEQARARA